MYYEIHCKPAQNVKHLLLNRISRIVLSIFKNKKLAGYQVIILT